MEFEIEGLLVSTLHGRTKKIPSYDITTVDPESMFNGKDEPSRYHMERLLPQTPLAAKLESTACGPAGEFADRDQCVKMISQHGEISSSSTFSDSNR
jgi:hypothetical protein